MPDQNRFGKSSRSYAVDTPRERGIKAYNRNLREGLGSGRNVQRIRQARENRTLNRPPRWDQKLGRDVGTMVRDTTSPFKTALMHGADLFAQGLGSFSEAEKARVGGKFNAPLNVKKGTNAYGWLLDHVIKDEYEDDFKREVKKDNLYWTELNKYAKDKYIGGGQLARGINARNEGIIGTNIGSKKLNEVLQEKEGDTPAIRNTIANYQDKILRDLDAGYRRNAYVSASPEAVTIEDDMPTGRYPFPVGMDMAPTEGMSDEERAFQESLMDDTYFQENFDTETGAWRSPPRIEDVADSASRAENIAALDRIMAQDEYPMINAPAEALPPFLSGDTDWWTPEPEEEDLRGWDWINEPVMKHYGVDRPSEEIERVWPNTPPPGYGPPPSWYQKYLDQFGFNTGYDYYNE